MPTYILSHSNCFDGFAAQYSYWLAVQQGKEEAAAEYRGVAYGCPLDVEAFKSGDRVFILDFAYDRETMERLRARVAHLEVLDHHATSAKALDGFPGATFNMDKSGAMLAWERFHPGVPTPKLIEVVQARDLWRFEPGSETECLIAWIRSHPLDFETWNRLDKDLRADDQYGAAGYAVMEGEAILRANRKQVDAMAAHHSWVKLGDYVVPCANATTLYSEVGERLCIAHPEAPFAAYFTVRSDGLWQWGLRRRTGDVHLGELAKTLCGGGGHAAAAGMVEPVEAAMERRVPLVDLGLDSRKCERRCHAIEESLA